MLGDWWFLLLEGRGRGTRNEGGVKIKGLFGCSGKHFQ